MHDQLDQYRPPLNRFLSEYMDVHKDEAVEWLDVRAARFERTMRLISQVLGDQAFRLIGPDGSALRDPEGKVLPRGLNRALFDAQGMAFSWVTTPFVEEDQRGIVESIAEAPTDNDLRDAVRRATGDRSRLRLRIKRMVEALTNGGLQLEIPANVQI
jgi:hypothetical protein